MQVKKTKIRTVIFKKFADKLCICKISVNEPVCKVVSSLYIALHDVTKIQFIFYFGLINTKLLIRSLLMFDLELYIRQNASNNQSPKICCGGELAPIPGLLGSKSLSAH